MTKTRAEKPGGDFVGFADAKMKFFHELDAHQSREWFALHKGEFERGWAEPMAALLAEVAGRIAREYRGVALRDPKVFRLHRDVRFSLDKSPYKTNVSGVLSLKGRGSVTETPAALYLQLGVETFAGAGMYGLMGDALRRYRAAVVDNRSGAALAKLVAEAEGRGFSLESMETLKTAPRGVDKNHPRIELLKRKGLVTVFPTIPPQLVTSRGLVDWITERTVESAPIVRWLASHVC